MSSYKTRTASLKTSQRKEVIYTRINNTSTMMISITSQKKEEVSAEPLRSITSYAHICCEGQKLGVSHMTWLARNSGREGKARRMRDD